jgi:uncharacterized protein (TIGR00251 family)
MNQPPQVYISGSGGAVLIRVYVQPRASKNRVQGLHNGEVKIALTAPPVDNAANEELVRFIADLLSVPKSSVTVKTGRSSRHKTLAISGKTQAEVESALGQI